jgi:hypothetical protein
MVVHIFQYLSWQAESVEEGEMDEECWQSCEPVGLIIQMLPTAMSSHTSASILAIYRLEQRLELTE